ncbi:hypothetical protein N0572_29745, partial [Pseudomonas aeruginosa]|nr:hypothetical protein [Pseudomonas aeruginosa]MCS9822384.1 hypothetical protein [Pseudomonas aeruginosa]MCT0529949.1 hypothetical protein [Pseudomonas aeruginosa]
MNTLKLLLAASTLALTAQADAGDSTSISTAPSVALPTAVEGTGCAGNGMTAFSTTGLLLSCQSGISPNSLSRAESVGFSGLLVSA